MKSLTIFISVLFWACDSPQAPPAPATPIAAPVPQTPAPAPAPGPEQLGPVPPGSYVNHVGNPAVGSWGPNGQWQFHHPQSPEADSTWKYLAAAGVGAAGGAAISHMLTKKAFEEKHPTGKWTPAAATTEVATYRDKRGQPISREEYERRRAQSERDKAAHRARLEAQQKPQQQGSSPYRDKQGRFISKEEYERRQRQSSRDKAKSRRQRTTRRR